MKRIRMLVTMSSTIHGLPPKGGVCEIDDDKAENFIFSRIAELVTEVKRERKENATEDSTDRE